MSTHADQPDLFTGQTPAEIVDDIVHAIVPPEDPYAADRDRHEARQQLAETGHQTGEDETGRTDTIVDEVLRQRASAVSKTMVAQASAATAIRRSNRYKGRPDPSDDPRAEIPPADDPNAVPTEAERAAANKWIPIIKEQLKK